MVRVATLNTWWGCSDSHRGALIAVLDKADYLYDCFKALDDGIDG